MGALARQAADDGYELLVVVGGDGTLNEAVQGIAGRERPGGGARPARNGP